MHFFREEDERTLSVKKNKVLLPIAYVTKKASLNGPRSPVKKRVRV